MAKEYIKELHEIIESLEDGFDIHAAEITLIKNDMEDTLSPYKLLGESAGYLLEMFNEVVEFERKKPSDRVTASKKRLFALIDINTQLGQIVSYNQNLKLCNQQLVGQMQLLRLKNWELIQENKRLSESNTF